MSLIKTYVGVLALVTVVSPVTLRLMAEDWPTFRGPDRTGKSPETNLLDSWGADGPQLAWTAAGAGRGYASPAIQNGRVFTLGDGPSTAGNEDEYLSCFSAADGKLMWQTSTGPAWNEGKTSWQGSRSTPTVDGELVYVITPYGKLVCARTSDGAIYWQRDLKEDFGGEKRDGWGYSESPLVDGEKLVCTPGGPNATMVALDKTTGEPIWKCNREGDVGAGHSSIVISTVGNRKIYVQNTGGGPMGVDAETGDLLWTYDMDPPTAFIPTPVLKDDYVFAVAGYKLGAALLQQIPGRDGGISVKEVYGPKTELGNKHGGVVRIGDFIYGGVEDQSIIYCANMLTGEIVWRERADEGRNSTSVISADGKLFVRFQNGIMELAEASPDGYKKISSFQTPGSGDSEKPSWAHPVIANGQLLLREDDNILAYNISRK